MFYYMIKQYEVCWTTDECSKVFVKWGTDVVWMVLGFSFPTLFYKVFYSGIWFFPNDDRVCTASTIILNHHLGFSEIFPEFFWCTTFLFSENSIKVGKIVKSALITNFSYRISRINKESSCIPQSDCNDIICDRFTSSQLIEPA